jgi:hypothetical protein
MLTCADDEPEWETQQRWQCCLCGSYSNVANCPLCGHDFCENCRKHYFRRGLEAVKTLLGRSDLLCGGRRHA